MSEIYISVDVETDGPIPGPNSMLSLGAAAFKRKSKYSTEFDMVGTFEINIEPLVGATPDPDTEDWWAKQDPAVYARARRDPQGPLLAMQRFVAWVEAFQLKPVFVAFPAGFDFLFVYWYLVRFLARSPFSFSALDLKSYALAVTDTGKVPAEYRNMTKRALKQYLPADVPHTHVAVDDAIEQGWMFVNLNKAMRASANAETDDDESSDARSRAADPDLA